MVFLGVSKFGNTNLIFVDTEVKLNGTYGHDVLLIEYSVYHLEAYDCFVAPL